MANIIVKKYEHYNRSLGKYISSKAQYNEEMARGGYITQDKADAIAEKKQAERNRPYIASKELRELTTAVAETADSKGRIRPGGRAIEKFK